MEDKIIKISINIEKVFGKGEDAEPILDLYKDGDILISVFDGLGGAGSSIYKDEDGMTHTGAYYASRFAKDIVKEYFINYQFSKENNNIERLVNNLRETLSHR